MNLSKLTFSPIIRLLTMIPDKAWNDFNADMEADNLVDILESKGYRDDADYIRNHIKSRKHKVKERIGGNFH